MNDKIIDGKIISDKVLENLKKEVVLLKNKNITPKLAVVILGNDNASMTYVRNKKIACDYVGIANETYNLDEKISEDYLKKLIIELNERNDINGILVQLPLPKHINTNEIINLISYTKDVDGFSYINKGNLFIGNECLKPCTPKGIIEMIDYINYDLEGKNVVIIGRSNIVGKPLALMMLDKNATVTICHSKTKNIEQYTKSADLIVSAVGIPKFVTSNMIKSGSVIIDVGINRIDGKLCGDVDFDDCINSVSKITPVPGGVGKMTIAMLMENTILACKMQSGL